MFRLLFFCTGPADALAGRWHGKSLEAANDATPEPRYGEAPEVPATVKETCRQPALFESATRRENSDRSAIEQGENEGMSVRGA